jgi:hypothetical protein
LHFAVFRSTRLSVSYSGRFSFVNDTQQVEVDSGKGARRSYRQGFVCLFEGESQRKEKYSDVAEPTSARRIEGELKENIVVEGESAMAGKLILHSPAPVDIVSTKLPSWRQLFLVSAQVAVLLSHSIARFAQGTITDRPDTHCYRSA